MKFVTRTIFILCFLCIGITGSLKAASIDNECLLIEEGWRSRKYLAVNFYEAYYGVDFTSLHAEMSAQEESISTLRGKGNNVALIRFSVLTESVSGGLKIYPNFYRLYSKQPREKEGHKTRGEEFVFISGTHGESVMEGYRIVNNEELLTTSEVMAECTSQYRSADIEDSVLKFSQAQQDAEELYSILESPILSPQNHRETKEKVDKAYRLSKGYLDSEPQIARVMHGKPLRKDMGPLLEDFINQLQKCLALPESIHMGEKVKTIII